MDPQAPALSSTSPVTPRVGVGFSIFVIHNCFQVPLALLVSQDNKVCPIL